MSRSCFDCGIHLIKSHQRLDVRGMVSVANSLHTLFLVFEQRWRLLATYALVYYSPAYEFHSTIAAKWLRHVTSIEARLALALSRGMSIPEAASKLDLKVGTVRKYSKTIYAKLGARGLADLVRIVLRSVLSLAPER